MKKILTLIIAFALLIIDCNAQSWSTPSADKNYILTRVPRIPIQNPVNLDTVSYLRMNNSIQYYDGIGRNLQVIKVKNSVTLKDEVQPFEYDNIGRTSKNYLPYTDNNSNGSYKSNALTLSQGVYGFYKTTGQKVDTTTFPYGQILYEESPLNRVIEAGSAGKYWQPYNTLVTGSGHTKKNVEGINAQGEALFWKVTSNGATTAGNYPLGMLYKTIAKNENWSSTDSLPGVIKEFTNKNGQLILKRQLYRNVSGGLDSVSTYYIYDEMDNLAYVVPPAANIASFTENDPVFKEFIYAYRYDNRKRVINKKVPGKGWMNLVYNKLDQVVLTQDSVQRAKTTKEWSFIKYDAFGRIILTGIYKGNESRDSAQARVNRNSAWESKGSFHGYTLNSYPKSALNVLTAFYYDDYNFPSASTSGFTYVADSLNSKTDIVRGLLTGSKTKILGTKDSTLTVNYYDVYGRLIQSRSHNQVGGMDIINNKYAFTNQVLVSKRVHTGRNSQSVTILKWYEYDHAGRKKKIRQKIGSDNVITLAQYNYNELGQLIEKNLHSTNGSTFAQSIDYRYNIQGWLRNINKADLGSDGGVTNDDSNDKFGMELLYETGTNPQYNSNISAMNWKGGKLLLAGGQGYKFSYDHLDRLTRAITTVGPVYHENISYDKMGNIQKLGRYSQGTLIDSLTYSYYNNNNSNQLLKIEDTGTSAGFNNGSTSSSEYTYDGNGNMLKDLNAGISTDIAYNYLNLPELTTKNTTTIKHTYDAAGTKIKRRIVGSIDSVEYANGIQYINGVIDFIQTDEGRAVKNGSSYLYRYGLTDHLGNLRVEIDASGTALQEESYYPFGLSQSLPGNIDPSAKNKYMYNGKEFQNELSWYDYGARFYNVSIGRWSTIDPLAEQFIGDSPYEYTFNNPINLIDPTGMGPEDPPSKKNYPSQIPGTPKITINTGNETLDGILRGIGNVLRNIAPIRPADENDPKTLKEAWENFKNIPSNLAKIPEAFSQGNFAQKTELSITMLATVWAMKSGKVSSSSTFVKAGFNTGKVANYINQMGKCVEYAAAFKSQFARVIEKVGGKVNILEINIGKNNFLSMPTQQLSNNGMHRIVEVIKNGESMIYDNFHPNGILKSEYIKNIEGFSREKGLLSGKQLFEDFTTTIK